MTRTRHFGLFLEVSVFALYFVAISKDQKKVSRCCIMFNEEENLPMGRLMQRRPSEGFTKVAGSERKSRISFNRIRYVLNASITSIFEELK